MADNPGGRLAGKVALISGGARGQGEAEARLFVSEGAKVVLGDVRDAQGEAVAADLGAAAAYRHLDVRSESDWAAIAALAKERFGGVDVLVNNAGIFKYGPLLETTLEAYQETIDINQTGTFLGMRAVAPLMIEQARGGSIINISSVAGLGSAGPFHAYGASKWAVRGMTKSAARELAPHKIRVNSVHPSGVATPMILNDFVVNRMLENPNAAVSQMLLPDVPLVESQDVTEAVLWLVSPRSRYVTGVTVPVDAGHLVM